jgi:hypothetical protein
LLSDLSKWVHSKSKEAEGTNGMFELSHGKYYGDAKADQGAKTTPDARFYQYSAKMNEFSNKGKELIVQYSVKHEQGIDCGGGYIKILPKVLNICKFMRNTYTDRRDSTKRSSTETPTTTSCLALIFADTPRELT